MKSKRGWCTPTAACGPPSKKAKLDGECGLLPKKATPDGKDLMMRHHTAEKTTVGQTQTSGSIYEQPIPDYFVCPISRMVMRNPVMARDGQTYENSNIRAYITSRHSSGEDAPSPMRMDLHKEGKDLQLGQLMRQMNLKAAIEDWVKQMGGWPKVEEMELADV